MRAAVLVVLGLLRRVACFSGLGQRLGGTLAPSSELLQVNAVLAALGRS